MAGKPDERRRRFVVIDGDRQGPPLRPAPKLRFETKIIDHENVSESRRPYTKAVLDAFDED